MTDRKIYIVKSSDDGMLGAYTNKKLAWHRVDEFILSGEYFKTDMNYQKLCAGFKNNTSVFFTVSLGYGTTEFEIKEMILNK